MLTLRVFFLLCVLKEAVSVLRIKDNDLKNFRDKVAEVQSHLDNYKIHPKLSKIIEKLPSSIAQKNSAIQFYACNICMNLIDEAMYIRRVELFNDTDIIDLAIELCVTFDIQSENVCRGVIELYTPTIIYIVDNRPDLSADTVCKFLLNDGDCLNPYNDVNLEFAVTIDESEEETPEILSTNSSSTAAAASNDDDDDIIIVHLTDIHVDFKYKMGALAACKDIACCRDDTNDIKDEKNSSSAAEYWGDYRFCDTPYHAAEDAFQQIVKQHPKIDVIYFTGDVVDHHVYDTSIEDRRETLSRIYGLMKKVFGEIPVYSILGNHENQNLFAPLYIDSPVFSTQWLYDHVVDLWSERLTNDSIQTLRDGGYYTMLIKPGFRIIALNNNLCFIFNFWVLYDVEPIREQFQWLHDTLLEAEQAGEKVHILAHIPSGVDSYHETCSREYQRIVERFHKTIVAQFNGHSENYDFHLFYKNSNVKNPIGIAFNGGAIASYSEKNRNYMVYDVDGKNYEVKEVQLWTYNLTLANLGGEAEKPHWYRQFSLKDDFNLPDLSATTLNELVLEMAKNSSIFEQYWRMKVKNSDLLLKKGCDKECFQDSICEILTSDNTNTNLCETLWRQLKRNH